MSSERPLLGEPLSLDLLNTVWRNRGADQDLLTDVAGTRAFLDEAGLADQATEQARSALITAREAIRAHVADPADSAALNDVLAWGRTWPVVGADGPGTEVEMEHVYQRAGWLAAVNYVDLLNADPTRVRACAHPDCVLHFYDTSPKRSRRWCSMAGCGNRAKAARHYAKARTAE
ncbi:MAG TPA: CGNR zinc finger domain-containing protein [Pseudonocardiaceae bacterium]|jgi:predicted RNA-binding Zn ribbon-like protein